MAGPVIGFRPHCFGNPTDHSVVPLAAQKAARIVPERGRLIFCFKVPPTLIIDNPEAPKNIHSPNTTDGKGKVVDAIATGSSSMAVQVVRNTDSPVFALTKPKIAEEVAVPGMQAERKKRMLRLKVATTKNTATDDAPAKNQKPETLQNTTESVTVGKVGSTALNNKANCKDSPNGKVVQDTKIEEQKSADGLKHGSTAEDKFEASKRKLEEQYKGIKDNRKKIRLIELKDLPKQQGHRSGAPKPPTRKLMKS